MEGQLHPMFQKMLGRKDDWSGTSPNESSLDYNFLTRHPTMSIVFLCVTGFTIVAGTTGNILIIGAVFSYKKLRRNTGNTVVVNLAVADLFITSIVGPFHIINVLEGPRFYMGKELLCQILGGVCTVSCVTSMMFIAAVAVNRYFCICKPSSYQSVFTRRKTVVYCCGLWILGLCIDLPNWLGWSEHTFNLKEMMCSVDRTISHSYTFLFPAFGIPVVIVFMSYIAIYRHVNTSHAVLQKFYKREGRASTTDNKLFNILPVKKEDVQLAITLFLTFVAFLIMWMPYTTVAAVDSQTRWPKQVYVITVVMGHSNSFLNSIIYGVSNLTFRQGYSVFLNKVRCF